MKPAAADAQAPSTEAKHPETATAAPNKQAEASVPPQELEKAVADVQKGEDTSWCRRPVCMCALACILPALLSCVQSVASGRAVPLTAVCIKATYTENLCVSRP